MNTVTSFITPTIYVQVVESEWREAAVFVTYDYIEYAIKNNEYKS